MLHEQTMKQVHMNFARSLKFLSIQRKKIDAFDLLVRGLGLSGHISLPDSGNEDATFLATCPMKVDHTKIMLMLVGHHFDVGTPFKSISQPEKDLTRWLVACYRESDGMGFTLQFNVPSDVA